MDPALRIPDNFETALFLQREPTGHKEPLFGINVTQIETQADVELGRWACGHCGWSNRGGDAICQSCGAPAMHARVRGRISIEGWLPQAGILYSLVDGFSMYISLLLFGRYDVYREEECIYRLENCAAGPVCAVDVVQGCRWEGDVGEPIKLHCDITCDCIYVGAPWKESEGEAK